MTEDQIKLVQDSFRLVLPIRTQAAALFYERLFEIAPEVRPLFRGSDIVAQGAKLMAALGFVAGALRQPEALLPAIRAMAVRHVGYGATAAHYAAVGAALLWTLEKGLGEAATPAVIAAWAAAYGLLSSTMIVAAQEAEASTLRRVG